jgi:hypothetical protein
MWEQVRIIERQLHSFPLYCFLLHLLKSSKTKGKSPRFGVNQILFFFLNILTVALTLKKKKKKKTRVSFCVCFAFFCVCLLTSSLASPKNYTEDQKQGSYFFLKPARRRNCSNNEHLQVRLRFSVLIARDSSKIDYLHFIILRNSQQQHQQQQ